MNVEGLWWYKIQTPGEWYGGVVVLETGRIFGGDSGVAILGSYSVGADGLAGEAETIPQDGDVELANIFGGAGSAFVQFALDRHGDRLVGGISPRGRADISLPMTLTFVRALP